VNFYTSKCVEDPDWVVRAALFHGHLGPWLIAGAMVGRDAIRKLETPGQWKINVTCWMPADKHRTPFTCILDGLQAGCGATMGKRNLWLRESHEVLADGWPVVHVVRLPERDRPAEGLSYTATCALHGWMENLKPERMEEASRELAREDVANLFRITSMREREFVWVGSASAGQTGTTTR